jgi:putative membrane protein
MWYAHEGMGWWMVFGAIWMALFWGVVIGLVAWAVTRFTGPRAADQMRTPLQIAQERYARGEITREQYEQLRTDLGGGDATNRRAA